MTLLLLLALLQGQATNQPGIVWKFKAEPVTVYYLRLSDDTFEYQIRVDRGKNIEFDLQNPEPENEALAGNIPLLEECRPAGDGCNTVCCTGNFCTETLAYCMSKEESLELENSLPYTPPRPK